MLGGKNYQDIDRDSISSQIKTVILFQCIMLIFFALLVLFFNIDFDRKFIFICVIVYSLIYNIMIIFGYIFQATNNTYWYSTSLLIGKIVFLLFLVVSFILRINNYKIIILVYLGAQFLSSIYTLFKGKDLFKGRFIGLKKSLAMIYSSSKIGITLMLAYYSGSFILGFSKIMIERFYGLTIFGLVSFSISLISILLLFISQISLVMFPALRKVDFKKQVEVYKIFWDVLHMIFPILFFSIMPIMWFVKLWLPDYISSLKYLIILLPISLFEMRSNLLGVTFLKIWNKPTKILMTNFISLLVTFVLITTFIFITKNIDVILIIIVIILFFRSLLFENYTHTLSRIDKRKHSNKMIELISIIVFYSMYLFLGKNSFIYFYVFLAIIITLNVKQYKVVLTEIFNLKRS